MTLFTFPADAAAVELFACAASPAAEEELGADVSGALGIQIWIRVPTAPEPFGSGAAESIVMLTSVGAI